MRAGIEEVRDREREGAVGCELKTRARLSGVEREVSPAATCLVKVDSAVRVAHKGGVALKKRRLHGDKRDVLELGIFEAARSTSR